MRDETEDRRQMTDDREHTTLDTRHFALGNDQCYVSLPGRLEQKLFLSISAA